MADKGLEKQANKRVRQKKKTNHMRNDEILNLHYGEKKRRYYFPCFKIMNFEYCFSDGDIWKNINLLFCERNMSNER